MLGWVGALAVAFTAATSPTGGEPTLSADLEYPAPEHAVLIYEYAADTAPCSLDWTVLGGVAGVASNHGQLDPGASAKSPTISIVGLTDPGIYGLPLDGQDGRANILDTDDGALDQSGEVDHAVGPFQFIPQTWEKYGTDGNGDGTADPQNFWDAAASAAALLCDKGVEQNADAALTGYFGTDQWNDWARRRANELSVFRQQRAALQVDLPSPTIETVVRELSPTSESLAIAEAVAPAAEPDPARSDEPSTDPPAWFADGRDLVAGDWDGDGQTEQGALEYTESGGRLVMADGLGRPYGRPIVIDQFLPEGELQQFVLVPLAGDWDSDGHDTPALIVMAEGQAELFSFDRKGAVLERSSLGPADPVAVRFKVASTPPPSRAGPNPVFWKEETAHDGTVLRLFKVEQIVVDESIAQDVADLVGAAAAAGHTIEAWGWRSHQQQIDLRRQNCADIWTTPASACSPPTARPGTSRHEFGLALDFHTGGQTINRSSPLFIWLTTNAAEFGLENLPSEPWHWSVDGG